MPGTRALNVLRYLLESILVRLFQKRTVDSPGCQRRQMRARTECIFAVHFLFSYSRCYAFSLSLSLFKQMYMSVFRTLLRTYVEIDIYCRGCFVLGPTSAFFPISQLHCREALDAYHVLHRER